MELFRCLGSLLEPPGPETSRLAELLELGVVPDPSLHTDLFSFQLYPLASVYLDNHGKIGGDARDRIAGFWRALGLEPPPEPDHLAVLLAFYSEIKERELESGPDSREQLARIRSTLLWEHLLSWLPVYLDKAGEIAPPFYRRWASLLARALAEEAQATEPLPHLPLHLRSAEPLVDPRDGSGEVFLESLLSPVRSGIILVRTDLERAGQELELGVRKGERLYVLKSLLGQDDAATLAWLSSQAAAAAARQRTSLPKQAGIADFWADRAETTARTLAELATDLDT